MTFIYIYIYIYRQNIEDNHHHHHHIVLVARISLTLSRHSSLSFIAIGRSSGQHPKRNNMEKLIDKHFIKFYFQYIYI